MGFEVIGMKTIPEKRVLSQDRQAGRRGKGVARYPLFFLFAFICQGAATAALLTSPSMDGRSSDSSERQPLPQRQRVLPAEEITKGPGEPRVLPGSDLIGMRIRNSQGERIGRLTDLVLELKEGRIVFAVISTGGFLGIGAKATALPPGLLSLDPEENALLLELDREQLEKAPSFEGNNWPELAVNDWVEATYHFYGEAPFWFEKNSGKQIAGAEEFGGDSAMTRDKSSSDGGWKQLYRATMLIGMKLRNPDNQPMAGVRDLVVDLEHNKVPYALVSIGGFLGIGEQLIAVPPSSLLRHSTGGRMATEAQRDGFSNLAAPWRTRGKALTLESMTPMVHLFSAPFIRGWFDQRQEGP
jgi:hypothetical protein